MGRRISSGKHYGIELALSVEESRGCCGIGMLMGFRAEFTKWEDVKSLTKRQKNKLYRALMHNILYYAHNWGILIGTDAVDGWSGGNAGGERPVDDMCMADFCRYFKFTESPMGDNGNSGNGVASFTLVTTPRFGDPMVVNMPKFPAPPKPKLRRSTSTGDRAAIIEQLRAAIHGA